MHWGMADTIIKSKNSEDQNRFFYVYLGNNWYLRKPQEAELLPASMFVLGSDSSAEVSEKIIR